MGELNWDFVCKWYTPDEIYRTINAREGLCEVPHDIHSHEFAEWLCDQYRLAMAKGIQLAKEAVQPPTPEES